jgi:hypothetical protein
MLQYSHFHFRSVFLFPFEPYGSPLSPSGLVSMTSPVRLWSNTPSSCLATTQFPLSLPSSLPSIGGCGQYSFRRIFIKAI